MEQETKPLPKTVLLFPPIHFDIFTLYYLGYVHLHLIYRISIYFYRSIDTNLFNFC